MTSTAPIKNIAIIGVNGHVGGAFARELLKAGNHNITALTRKESKGTVPEGIKAVYVDYDNEESLVEALRGQEFLIVTLSVNAPPDTQAKIFKAADKAGVRWVMPNAYGYDITNKRLTQEGPFQRYKDLENLIHSLNASWIILCCGYWYEWSLALGEMFFGIDIKNRSVTFFDDGNTKINTSTWDQCGRAIAALLSLPESGSKPSLENWKNGVLRIDSFKISQRDMLDSLNRVLGTTDKDWKIKHESSEERFKDAQEGLKRGERPAFPKAIYSRIFYPIGDGDYESSHGLDNDVLGLKKDDLDEYTKKVVALVESGWQPFG